MIHPSREELVAVLDGLSSDLDRPAEATRRHVDGCAECAAELARLEAGITLLRAGSPAPEPSPFFATRLAARLAAEPPRRRFTLAGLLSRPWRLAAAGGLAAALTAGVVLVQRTRTADELAVAERLELLEELEVVASVGDVESAEDVAIIAGLPGERSPGEGRP